ncbi:uncharacterized protein [Diabrotica undecimpunctata]|uniref:uncharacterized protein n=1 Tax=Diabrotica undecimpunctata TaxID=50387 RepID=UPI003B642453
MEKNSISGIRKLPNNSAFNFTITKSIIGSHKNSNTGQTTEGRSLQSDNESKRNNNYLRPSKKLCKRTEVECDNSERFSPVAELDIPNGVLIKGMIPYSMELDKCEEGSMNQYFDYVVPSKDAPVLMEYEDCDEPEPSPVCNGVNGTQKREHNSRAAGDRLHTEQAISTARSNTKPDVLPDNEILDYEVDSENDSKCSSLEADFSDEESAKEESDYEDVPTERQPEDAEMFEEEMLDSEFEDDGDINTQQETLSDQENDDSNDSNCLEQMLITPWAFDIYDRPVTEWTAYNHFRPIRLFLRDIGYISPDVAEDDHVFDVKSSNQFHQKVTDNFVFKSPLPPKPVPQKQKEPIITPPKPEDDTISLYASTLSGFSDDEDGDAPPSHFSRTSALEGERRPTASVQINSGLLEKPRGTRNFEPARYNMVSDPYNDENREENLLKRSRNSELRQKNLPNSSRNLELRQENLPNSSRNLRQENLSNSSRNLELRQENLLNGSRNSELRQENMPEPTKLLRSNFTFNEVPKVYFGLCFDIFFNGLCSKKKCNKSHRLSAELFISKCRKIKELEKLVEAYEFSKKFPLLFEAAYKCFIDLFVGLNLEEQLINCIFDIITLQYKLDFPKAIRHVIAALQNFSITVETFDKIACRVDFKHYPVLVEALIDALSAQHNGSQSWHMLRKLIHISNYISPESATRLLMRFGSDLPLDLVTWRNIYEEIIENKLTDLSKVSTQLITIIKKSLYPEKFKKGSNIQTSVNSGGNACNGIGSDNPRDLVRSRSDESVNESYMPYAKRPTKRSRSNEMIATDNQVETIDRYAPSTSFATSRPNAVYKAKSSTYSTESRQKSFIDQIQAETICVFPISHIVGEFQFKNPLSLTSSTSLHDLLPASVTQRSLDHLNLYKCIKFLNAEEFLEYLKQDAILSAIEAFLFQCIMEFERDYSNFLKMIEQIKIVQPSYNKNRVLKGVLEVIAFNLIILLDERNEHDTAKKIIETFLDWDSMLTSKILVDHGYISHMGKYILLASVLEKCNAFFLCFTVLSSLGLKLMQSPKKWPVKNDSEIDLQNRNALLNKFLNRAMKYAKPELCGLYKHMFSTDVYRFDAPTSFNSMLNNIFKQKDWSFLGHFSLSIEVFYEQMDLDKLRAFIVIMAQRSTSISQRLKYFECGCKRDIYPRITGQESVIKIEVNMPESEIQLFLEQYFYNMRLSRSKFSTGLTIDISLPFVSEGELSYLDLIGSTDWSFPNTNFTVRNLLIDYFRFEETQFTSPNHNMIRISPQSLMSWAGGH